MNAYLCTYTIAYVALVAACLHCVEKKINHLLCWSHWNWLTFNARGPRCQTPRWVGSLAAQHLAIKGLFPAPEDPEAAPHLEVPAEVLALGPQAGDVLQRGTELQPDPLQGERQRQRPSARHGPTRPVPAPLRPLPTPMAPEGARQPPAAHGTCRRANPAASRQLPLTPSRLSREPLRV